MLDAFLWGFGAASSLIIGALIALRFRLAPWLLGSVMAFGAGVLISAVAYDLIEEAVDTSRGTGGTGLGFALGALVYFLGNAAIDRMGSKGSTGKQSGGSGLSIVLGSVLDGVPESVVIGLSLVSAGAPSAAVVFAVFLSNLPEAIAGTTGLRKGGWPSSKVLNLWVLVALVSGLASLIGFALLDDAAPSTVAFFDAFAAGAILTMLATSMMPEAYKNGGNMVGLFTALGFAVAFFVKSLE